MRKADERTNLSKTHDFSNLGARCDKTIESKERGLVMMKRMLCVILIVLIVYAGCADKKQRKVTVVPLGLPLTPVGDWESNAVLKRRIVVLEGELRKARMMQRPDFLLARIDVLEEVLLQKIYELGYATTSQRNAVESAEVMPSVRG